MDSPSHPVLQKLHGFDRSLSGFHDQLSNVLYGEEYVRCAPNLQGDDLRWLVDFLDEAVDGLPPFSTASRKCLRELRSICGNRTILPASYNILSDLDINSQPFDAGGFGDVYKGTLCGSSVCVKRVRMYSQQDPTKAAKTFCREAVIWRHLKHPNVVPLLGTTIEPFQLISDWMPGGDLSSYLKNPNAVRLVLLAGVAEGLCYLHSRNVIHGDLKGQNILVDEVGHPRITDFGLAKVTQNLDSIGDTSVHSNSFTPRWTAPEVLKNGTHSKEADIFSFAMVMVEVFTGAVPFSDKPNTAAMFDIMNGAHPPRPVHPDCTAELWKLMNHCWSDNPHSRPAVVEVLSDLRGADRPTWKCLISDTLAPHERVSLITMIFSDKNQVKMVSNLSGDDAQIFVDKINEALDSLAPQIHRRCLRYLYTICGGQALIPRSLELPLCYDPAENPAFHGGHTDVWKGQHEGREVSAQVFRVLPGGDIEKIRRRFCRVVVTWRALNHPNLLLLLGVTMTENRLAMVSEWMLEGNVMEFTRANPNVDRLGLLRGVIRGLMYMHDQKIIHGDLKGVNILIDSGDNPRLTGFNLVTMASEHSTIASPPGTDGVIPWKSPELLYPAKFGLKNNHPTVKSDVYALGMVVYEVLSGQAPFAAHRDPEVVFMVIGGERPERPQEEAGGLFTNEIWEVLELCWKQQPNDRPNLKRVLSALEGELSTPPSDMDGGAETDTDDEQSAAHTHTEIDIESRSCTDGTPGSSIMYTGGDGEIIVPPRNRSSKRKKVRNALKKLFKRSSTNVDKPGDVSRTSSRHPM